jgi:hypothetical protein
MSKICVNEKSGCWDWCASLTTTGYGQIYVDGKKMKAHRWSYAHFIGDIPLGLFVCHSCDNRSCVNPEHLWLGTASDNNNDARRKGRLHYGDDHWSRVKCELVSRGKNHWTKKSPNCVPRGDLHWRKIKPELGLSGSDCGFSILDEEVVRSSRIEFLSGISTIRDLAERHGVKYATMYAAIKGLTWKHVK